MILNRSTIFRASSVSQTLGLEKVFSGALACVSHPSLVDEALIPRRLCFAGQFVDATPLTVPNQAVMEVVARLNLGSQGIDD